MCASLEKLLSEKKLLLADGATGTNLMDMGLEPGFPPDLWNVSHPEKPDACIKCLSMQGLISS